MTTDGIVLPCRDCGKAIAIVKVSGVLAYGHLVNPKQFHHEAMPPRTYSRPRAGGLSTNGSPAERVHGPVIRTDKRSRPLERVSTRSDAAGA